MIAGLMGAALAVQAASANCAARPMPARCVEGEWAGEFAGPEWTFDLRREGDRWTGRYRTTKAPKPKDLLHLAVTDGQVRFDIESSPTLTFVLAPNAAGAALTGEIRVGEARLTSFAAGRR